VNISGWKMEQSGVRELNVAIDIIQGKQGARFSDQWGVS